MSRHRSGQAGNTGERSGRRGWMGLALFAALTLGACDDGGGTAPSIDAEIDSTVDATPTDAEVDAEVDAGPVTLRFIAPEDGATLTGANDLTGDLADGLQIEARLAVQGAAEVNLSVDGAPAQRLPVVDGVARAVVALPVAEEATHRLEATAAAARAAVDVQVAVARCALVVEPLPGGGCDLGADDDADPIAPGLQTDLRIETDCPEVDVRVEGIAAAATVDNGRAVARITLRDGENEIRVQAKSPTALPAEIGPYRLVARVEAPLVALDLRAGAENVRGLDAARREGQSLYWQFTGQAVGLEAGDEVQVEFAPPLDAAATARVDPDGGFAVEAGLPADTLYIGAVTVRATDACGAESADMTYALRLDGVVPTLRLVAPADGTRLFRLDDIDGERPDVQVPITVAIDDARGDAAPDDLITVECAAPGGPWTDRAAGPGDARRRSALGDGPIVATFRLGEDGDIVCRAASAMRPNPPRAIESTWRLFFVEPTFALESPAAAPTCLTAPEVEIAGAGEHLTGNNPTLRAVLTDGGDFEQSVGLDPLGGGRFGARLDADALPDGNYTLRVEGEVFGRVPVTPIPAQRAVRVDRAGPTVVFLEPPAAAIIDLDPGTQGFQYAPRVQVCGAPGQPLTVERPGEAPYAVNLPEGSDCANVRLPTRTAALGPQTFVAHAADACGNATTTRLTTQVDPALVSARVLSPVDQARVNVESDADPARAGCQLEVSALVRGLSAQSPVDVCTSVAQGPAGALCDGRSSALSGRCEVAGVSEEGTTLRCPVSLNDGTHTLTVVGENGERVTSPSVSVRVDCAAPTVGALRIIEDVDANGCIHRQERQNVADAAATARVTLRFTVDGMEDGQAVRIRTDDGVDRGGALVQAGAGEAVITLPAGTHRLYLRGQDRAGNPLPEPGDVRPVTLLTLTVDPTPPTPALVGLVAGACLNGGADADPALADLQYALQVQSGRQAGEAVTAAASLDGAAPVERGGALDRVDFAPMTVGQGGHALRVTVRDACGNMGSVAGFARVGGRDDWAQPSPVAFSVDTIAPMPVLGGVRDGQVFAAEEDADGDAANGFQVDVSVGFAPGASVEGGRPIDLLVEGAPAVSSPSPLLAPADPAAIVDARLTLSGGAQSLVARAIDACGNEGGSAPVRLTVDIAGCNSRVVGFAANPAVLGPQDGLVDGASLRIDINGQVELLDPACVGAGASLLIDGAPAAQGAVPAGGDIQFTGVAVPRGAHALAIRVGPVGDQTVDSPPQQVIVDLATPNVRITQPTGAPPVQVLTDDRPDLDGQQTTVVAEVTEAAVDSARTAVLRLDGAPLGPPRAVPAGSPAMVSFVDVTLAAGPQTLEVCVTDGAGQSACASLAVDADAAAPDAVGDLTAEVIDPRRTEVALHFIAPGDDGAVGRVTAYALRRADAAIAAEADWNAAVATALALPATAAAGEAETLVLAGPGPGPLLADGLALDRLHFVAVRALDDAGRLGPIASVSVDLRLRRAEQLIAPRAGLWGAAALANTTSPVIGVGDVDGDGFDDVLVSAAQVDGVSQAALVFGAADPAAGEVRPLSIAAGMTDAFFGAVAAAAGDLNADGALDFAVQGYLDGFAGVAIALYFGCPDPDACDRAALAVPDALIVSRDGRFTNMLAGLGDFSRPAADGGAAIDDLFVGGSLGADQTAFVVAGRRIWPAPPAGVLIGNGAVDVGVTVLEVPEGPAGVYAAGVGDLDGDGFTDLALSAGADINASYVFYGGAGLAARLTYAAGNDRTVRLVDPCPGQGASFGTFFAGGVDLDGDAGGRPDFVVSNRINKRLAVFDQDLNSTDCFGRSPGQFGRVFDLAGDIDGDGALDLVVTHGDPTVNDAFVFYNDGAAVFGVGAVLSPRTAHVRLSLPASPKLGVAGAGDVNGDGRADLAAIYKRAGDGAVTVVVYY